jgi:hypothetical protein
MKQIIMLCILSQSILSGSIYSQTNLSGSTYSQRIRTKDLLGDWYAIFYKDSLKFNFKDTSATIISIRHYHKPDQEMREEFLTILTYHIVKFKKETLIIFDIEPFGIINCAGLT